MTEVVNVQMAKTHLSQLLARVERGEEIVIARGGVPIARLSGLTRPAPRELGFVDVMIPDSFGDALSDAELDAWT